eukprot:762475-Hanusia_phi.AAC.3
MILWHDGLWVGWWRTREQEREQGARSSGGGKQIKRGETHRAFEERRGLWTGGGGGGGEVIWGQRMKVGMLRTTRIRRVRERERVGNRTMSEIDPGDGGADGDGEKVGNATGGVGEFFGRKTA